MPDLGSTLSLNTSSFGAGIAAARAKLTELNTSLIENRNKMKEVNKEASELQKQEKALAEAMKDGGTKEQQEEMQKLRDRIGQVNAELGTLKTREREIQSDIRKASNELDNQKNGMNNLANAGDGVANSLKKIETGLKSVITMAAGKKLFDYFIGSNAEMEQYLTSFEVMLGDAKKAKELMSSLNDMAAKTPMELTDVVSSGTLLMNYGVSADELIDKMTQLGDLASGNAQKFERVSLAYGQMLAKGKVSGEELRQMTEAGVPLLQALADTIGVSTGEIQDLVSKGKVGITELDAAIASMTTGTGQFAGMMEKQSQTFSGMLSTLSDNATQFGRDVGEKAFEVAKDSLAELLDMLDEWRKDGTLDEIAEDAGDVIGGFAELIKNTSTFLIENKEVVIGVINTYIALKGAMAIKDVGTSSVKTIRDITTSLSAMGPAALATTGQIAGLVAVIAAVGMETAYYIDKIAGLSDEVESTQRSVQRLTDTMNDSIAENEAEMNVIKAKAEEYEKLRNTENLTASEQERLKSLANELQDIFGDEVQVVNTLTGEYNDLSAAVANYVEQQTKKVKFSALEESAKEAYKKIEEIKRKMNERSEEHTEYQQSFHLLDWNGAVETTSWMNDMAAYREEIEKCQKIIDDYNTAIEEGAYITTEASNAVDEATKKAKELEEQLARAEERKKTIDDLTDATKNLVSEYSSLSDSLKDLENGEAISYEKMQALIKIYPELARHIQVTADGYVVETGALGDLNTALMNGANAQIEAENAKTRAAIEGARDRILLYQKEAEAAAMYEHDTQKVLEIGRKIGEEEAYIAELQSKIALNNSLPDYFNSNKGSGNNKKTGGNKKKEDNTPTLKSISNSAKTISSAFAEMKKSGELTLATVQSVIDAGYESALSYDEVTGKWTISAKAYETAANKQIEEAKKAEGVTKTQCSALDSLRGILDEVTAGTYGAAKATEKLKDVSVSSTTKNMKTLAEAVSEQNTNGFLSSDTVSELADTDYSTALTVGVDGKITLNTKELEDTLTKEIDDAISQLEKKLATVTGKEAKAIETQINVFKQLKNSISDVSSGTYGVKEKVVSDEQMKAVEDSANRRLKLIDAELKAKQKLRDETLKAIDDEVQARKRLTEDNDIQRQIDQVMAQLKYSQLDEFSRAQLERKLQSLNNDKADMLWERGIEDRKAAANEQFDAESERLNAEKDAINNSLEVLNKLNDTFVSSISDLGETIKAAMEAVKPDSTINITLNDTDKMTAEQLFAFIEDKYGATSAI